MFLTFTQGYGLLAYNSVSSGRLKCTRRNSVVTRVCAAVKTTEVMKTLLTLYFGEKYVVLTFGMRRDIILLVDIVHTASCF